MYETFYNFREKPFSLLPDPSFLYLSEKHDMALSMLQYGLMNQVGITVITGEVGSGKTTLIRELLNEVTEKQRVGLISNTHSSFGDLMQWVLMAYGLEYKGMDKAEMYDTFTKFMISQYSKNRRTILIIDEAQNMQKETLEELRLLSNINADKDQIMQLIIVGQTELRDMLTSNDLRQFAQRVSAEYHLEPLDMKETYDYIKHRLKVADGDPDIFTTEACAAVYYFSRGVPRLINTLCDTALVCGYADQQKVITKDMVREVAQDKIKGGIFPMREVEAAENTKITNK